jgi:hypothetical protein
MGNIILTQMHAASDPILFHSDNPKNLHARVTGIRNDYKDKKTGKWVSVSHTIDFWGPTAEIAAQFLKKGTCFHVEGDSKTRDIPTGQVNASGNPILIREGSVRCNRLILGGSTMKEIRELVAANLAAMYASGRIPQNVTINVDELVTRNDKPQKVAYDLNVVRASNGKFGNARVWVPGEGHVKPQSAAGTPAPAMPAATPGVDMNTLANLVAMVQAGQAAAAKSAGAGVNIFG